MTTVLQIFRKRNPAFFSIEKVFGLVQPALQAKTRLDNVLLPHYTHGFLSVFRNLYFVKRLPKKNVYHVTGDVHYAVLALPASRTILTIHDCVFLNSTTGIKRTILKWLLLDLPVKRCAIITTISAFTKEEILKNTVCDANKIVVIPNPVNNTVQFIQKDFNAVKPVVLFIGTTANKNLERVVPALQGISCHLLILGKSTPAQQQLLVKYQVDFSERSNVSENELAGLYRDADIVLFPSTFEGFGLPILEGQKAGRVIITSNIEPMKTVAGGGAVLVDPYSWQNIRAGIEKVISNQDLRNGCINLGFRNLERYDPARIADAYYHLYEKITANEIH